MLKIYLKKLAIFSLFSATTILTACNSTPEVNSNSVALACEKGLHNISREINLPSHKVKQVNISRANSLLLAAKVQHQFAEYTGCLDKLQRAKDYLSGENSAIISKLSFNQEI